jgi:hypothetical protein
VYTLLTIREATVGAGPAVVHNAAFPVVLFMRPASVVALGSYRVSRQACIAGLEYLRVCFSCERSAVAAMAHACVFNLAEVSVSSARAYFLGWDGSLAAVMVPLLKIAARLKNMLP